MTRGGKRWEEKGIIEWKDEKNRWHMPAHNSYADAPVQAGSALVV